MYKAKREHPFLNVYLLDMVFPMHAPKDFLKNISYQKLEVEANNEVSYLRELSVMER